MWLYKNLSIYNKEYKKCELPHVIFFSKESPPSPEAEQDQVSEVHSPIIMSFVTEEHFVVEEYTESHVVVQQKEKEEKNEDNEEDEQKLGSEGWAIFRADEVEIQLNLKQRVEKERTENAEKNDDDDTVDEQFFIGKSEFIMVG